ncbi:MT-A70-domain-containing protein [Gaertneriomyces semiglobifer]|nr:MT-A70-domain-containing protein [Gaertneriomyces semiglobifer]
MERIHYNGNNVQVVVQALQQLHDAAEDSIILDCVQDGDHTRWIVLDVHLQPSLSVTQPVLAEGTDSDISGVHRDINAPNIMPLTIGEVPPELKEIDEFISKPTYRESVANDTWKAMADVIYKPTARQNLIEHRFQGAEDIAFREYCEWCTRMECKKYRKDFCTKVHFRRIMKPHTDLSLGDCSYLNTCHRMEQCKYVHYDIDEPNTKIDTERPIPVVRIGTLLPAQWIQCDIRRFDLRTLGKFSVIMADPPWDIHMNLPYGTMTDDEMKAMQISTLQDEGFLFLWVTGRAMELGRECMRIWGYKRVEELIWVKIMQLQKLIRTGRTGHWMNHSKEHCLVGVKGAPNFHNARMDTDVIVAEVRETSRKPDEVYGLIDRLAPGTRKLEIFGRMHNTRDGWLTLGNQLGSTRICEPDLLDRFSKRYPEQTVTLFTPLDDQ